MNRFQALLSTLILPTIGAVAILFVLQIRTNQKLEKLVDSGQKTVEIHQASSEKVSSSSTQTTKVDNTQASISALLSRIEKLEEGSGSVTPQIIQQVTTAPSFQPQVMYLGSSSTTSRDWAESGVEVSLNKSDYPSGVSISFQAGLSVIGGEAWARLKNKTTGAVISISEVFHAGSTTTWKSSPNFELHSGSNSYVVEIRSTSGETANLDGARLILSK